MLHLDQVRLLAAGILCILTLILGTLPVYLLELINGFIKRRSSSVTITPYNSIAETSTTSKWFQHDRIVQFLTQIGGGVLFYTAFIHMLPEIRENYESYLKNQNNNDDHNGTTWAGDSEENETFSFMPECIVDVYACVGLFGMFLLEELMHSLLGDHHHHHQTGSQEQNHRSSQRSYNNNSNSGRRFSLRQCMEKRKYSPQIDDEYRTSHSNLPAPQDNENGQQTSPKKQTNALILPLSETHPISSQRQTLSYNTCGQSNCDVKLAHHHGPNNQPIQSRSNDVEQVSFSPIMINDNFDEQNCSIWPYVIENFLLILAFSCHSLFDGISIGVQKSEKEIWTMLIAILSHKLLIAFILSFQIYEKCQYKTVDPTTMKVIQKPIKFAKLILWIFSTLFALMSPLGIVIVIFMNNITSDQNRLDIIILAAVSAGTILYIVFLEIIDKLHSRTHINGIVQWIALAIGFIAMNIISQLFRD